MAHWPIYRLDRIDSTNSEAKRRAGLGDVGNYWITAREQTAGRGRLDRTWRSPVGNLYATALFEEPDGVTTASRVPFAAALAVVDVVTRCAPTSAPRLKWPNDVRCGGLKVSGILIETGYNDGALWVAAGIGVNVSHTPEITGQGATSIADLREDTVVTVDAALAELVPAFAARLNQARNRFSDTLADWLDHAESLGEAVTAGSGRDRVTGVFEGLAADGGLILRLPNGETRTIRAGDVNLVREA
jgi:BirA family biotin operon repressor/biotin-[acetyl-CoA-carboxylase] ligase